ncbi:oxygenase MpaB family protein [Nocardioides sp. 616]|uniref:oxygenase MpaB family protein n=1 Tax=Nocardioides sp. 616 TaxID=2268090 RepID=UPI000CE33E78|nr:oxygenase MpaB family protein [Nocardioides sp. 616]
MTSDTESARPEIPHSVSRVAEARQRFPALAPRYFEAMWEGDPLADAFVADVASLGHGRAMRMLRTACREGIDSVPQAPESLRALFVELDDVPDWVDLAAMDHAYLHVGRYTRQAGIVLGAASLVSGYANATASRPLEMTGRYVESAGMRTIEVASWLVEASAQGGLQRHAAGFELTVRVRIIHALVRAALVKDPRWQDHDWGVPICQAFLAYTLVEFCLIPLRGMAAIGAALLPHEVAGYYARWRYVGHLLGIHPDLLPGDQTEQEQLEEIYLFTRPEVDGYCRDLVASINAEFLVPEIEQLLPHTRLHRVAPSVVHGLERVFLGDRIADELGIPDTRVKTVIRAVGPVLGAVNRAVDRVPGSLAARATLGERYRVKQDARLRARYDVHHDLVDAAPSGEPHPAREQATA